MLLSEKMTTTATSTRRTATAAASLPHYLSQPARSLILVVIEE